ncbi:hypothetical protein MMC25_007769 [Agyrium rufum]|nr:hypothetical protein [Agyrium rufum]
MLSRSLRRAFVDSQSNLSALPPIFLLPCRAYFSTISNSVEPDHIPSTTDTISLRGVPSSSRSSPPLPSEISPLRLSSESSQNVHQESRKPESSTSEATKPITQELLSLLPALRAQSKHYATIHIHARPYLLQIGDTLRLPFRMPDVQPGDILRLNRLSSIGSRDYTLNGAPYVDERVFEARAIVVGTESEPMRVVEKTVRRRRKVKRVKSKLRFTILRMVELKVKSGEEIMAGNEA